MLSQSLPEGISCRAKSVRLYDPVRALASPLVLSPRVPGLQDLAEPINIIHIGC